MRRSVCIIAALLVAGCGSEAPDGDAGGDEVSVLLPPPEPRAAAEPAMNDAAPEADAAATAGPLPGFGAAPAPSAAPPQQSPPGPPEPAPAAAPEVEPPSAQPQEQADAGDAETPDRLPLPAATIASTIRRIGYACPQVASSAPMAGAGSSRRYRITCSSGDAYRATVERGRMRFRRLDGAAQ